MNRKNDIYSRHLRECVTESMGTLNLITVFWLASREGGFLVPALRPVGVYGAKPQGRVRRANVV